MSFFKDENGQGMVEYALILAFISVVSIVILFVLGPKIRNSFKDANDKIPSKK